MVLSTIKPKSLSLVILTVLLILSSQAQSAGSAENLFNKLLQLVLPENYEVTWANINFSADLTNLKVNAVKLCLNDKKVKTHICFQKFSLKLPFLRAFIPNKGSHLHLLKGKGVFTSVSSTKNKEEKVAPIDFLPFLSHLKKIKLLDLKIELDNMTIIIPKSSDKKTEEVKFNASLTNSVHDSQSKLKIKVNKIQTPFTRGEKSSFQITILINNKNFSLQSSTSIDLPNSPDKLSPQQNSLQKNNIKLSLKSKWVPYSIKSLPLAINIDGVFNKEKLELKLQNQLSSFKLKSQGSISISNRGVHLKKCHILAEIQNSQKLPEIRCEIDINSTSSVNITASGQINCKKNICSLNLDEQKLGKLSINASLPTPLNLDKINSDFAVSIKNFKEIAEILKKTDIGIPAPFALLQGPVKLTGSATPAKDKKIKLELTLISNLKSDHQSIRLQSESFIDLQNQSTDKKIQLVSDTLISDVQIVLPTLKLEPMPAFSPDSRIKIKETMPDKDIKKETVTLSYKARLHTEKPNSLLIKTNLVKKPIPISFDISQSSIPPTLQGFVQTKNVELEFFRRKALLETLRVDLKEDVGKSPVDGKIYIEQNDYKILISILGTINEPFIRMESTPFLPPADILSVLLFGKTNSQLGGSESDSVSGLQAAMASRAFSLLSLFFLSSTPIESILYDPTTNTVTASVKLAGNRLSLASQSGNVSQVGLERKVYRNIILRTYKNLEDDDTSTTTVLEWEKRY